MTWGLRAKKSFLMVLLILLTFSALLAASGCGNVSQGGGTGNTDGRDGGRDAAAADEETMAPGQDRPASGAAREQAGLGVEIVSPGGAYLPAGFGEGSLWATEPFTCNDGGSGSPFSSGGASFSASAQAMCAMPNKMLLKRLDPRTGEEVATITLEDFATNTTEVAVGAGSTWVSSASGEAGAVLRVDPETNRVVDRIPVGSPTSVAFGHGSVWVTSAGRGTLSRVDPRTGEVAAEIEVGRGAVDVAVDEGSGAVWVAAGVYVPRDNSGGSSREGSEYNKLSRVDAATNRVVAEIPIAAREPEGGAQGVAVGEGAVWAQGVRGRLFKVDPATNEVVAEGNLGDYSSDLAVYGGAVWATAQVSVGTRLFRVDPRTAQVVASEDGPDPSKGGYGPLAAGGGYVWFGSGDGLARVEP